MPSLDQLQAESWWGRETIPPNLAALRTRLLNHWKLSGSAIGIKGDANHLRGYHRSREWIKNSKYATNRSYSVSETSGNKSGGDSRWIAAMDITLPTAQLLEVCKRLDAAVRAGRLEKVTEWYGNVNGDRIVDGYDNIRNRVASSDSSHLWHLHMSFDRGRVNDNHDDVFAVLTGTATEGGTSMSTVDHIYRLLHDGLRPEGLAQTHDGGIPIAWIVRVIKEIQDKLNALSEQVQAVSPTAPAPGSPLDPAALQAALVQALQDPAVLSAVAKAVNDDHHRRMEK